MFGFGQRPPPLEVGAPAPPVAGLADSGETISFADIYAAHRYTLVYFYPKADTPGCTRQSCSLRDAFADLSDRGVAVIGVSHDPLEAQRAFKARHRLPFTLIADTDKTVSSAFGANGLLLPRRQAYLIRDDRIVYADHDGSTDQQAADILALLPDTDSGANTNATA